jgi:serine/threonine-protein kinase
MAEDSKAEEPARPATFGGGRLPAGARFARYRIVREVGSGGMGAVYEAVLVDLNKRVALKVLSADLSHKGEHRERFMREGRAAARIRHPNVVEIFDVGEHDGQPFLAMEFLVGTDLRARYDKGPLTPADLLDLVLPVLAAIVTAHDAHVVHRDLKPENIFLNEHPGHGVQPIVLDFGISKVLDDVSVENLTATSTMVGTPLYMSPEQVRRSREVDPRTDQYALGVMLYEGLTGVSAFTGDSLYDLLLKKVQGEFAPLRTIEPELPEALCSVIERAMAADRELRYPTIRAFATALMPFARERTRVHWTAILSGQTGDGEMSPEAVEAAGTMRADSTLRSSVRDLPAVKPSSPARRWRWPAAVAALALTLAIGFALSRREPSVATPGAATVEQADAITDITPARPAPPELFTVQIIAEPPTASIVLDGDAPVAGTLTRQLVKDGKPHTLEISAEGFEPKRITFTDAAPAADQLKLVARVEPAPSVVPPEPAAPAEPAPRKRESSVRKASSPPSAAPPAGDAPKERPRRTVGSNDAPLLY